jgi:hypothetical protein
MFHWIRVAVFGLIVVGLSAGQAAAQVDPPDEDGAMGVKGGFLRSNFAYEDNQDLFSAESGWMVGAFATGNRARALTWMGELNLLKKSQLCGCNQQQVDLYYLQVPGLLRVNGGTDSGINPYGILGPALELKIGEELRSMIISEYSAIDVSLVAGAGVEVGRFLVELRGTWGLRNLGTNLPEDVTITSRTFAVLGGFRFR